MTVKRLAAVIFLFGLVACSRSEGDEGRATEFIGLPDVVLGMSLEDFRAAIDGDLSVDGYGIYTLVLPETAEVQRPLQWHRGSFTFFPPSTDDGVPSPDWARLRSVTVTAEGSDLLEKWQELVAAMDALYPGVAPVCYREGGFARKVRGTWVVWENVALSHRTRGDFGPVKEDHEITLWIGHKITDQLTRLDDCHEAGLARTLVEVGGRGGP